MMMTAMMMEPDRPAAAGRPEVAPPTPPYPGAGMRKKESALWGASVRYFRENEGAWADLRCIVGRPMGVGSTADAPSLRCVSYYVSRYTRLRRTELLPEYCVPPGAAGAAAAAAHHRLAAPGGGAGAPSSPPTFGPTDVYNCYRQMLKIHTKHRFDPFCRRDRTALALHGHTIETNVGQLVFFRWFIERGVLKLLRRDHDVAMHARLTRTKHRRDAAKKKVEEEEDKSIAAPASVPTTDVADANGATRIVVRFGGGDASGANGQIRIALSFD